MDTLVAKGSMTDTDGSLELDGAADVATFVIDSSTYAIVASRGDEGVQIIDISDPTHIEAKDSETDGENGFNVLLQPYDVSTFVIGSSTYAIVTSKDDDGVQIVEASCIRD